MDHPSNFTDVKPLSWVYFAATLDAAIWGAELAAGIAPGRIYVVEPTGPIIDDPNVTDKKFPGNPTLSFRSRDPLRVIAEVTQWQGHAPERLQQMKDNVARLKAEGKQHHRLDLRGWVERSKPHQSHPFRPHRSPHAVCIDSLSGPLNV